MFTSVLLVDELNRITPKAQSALLEAMAEGHVTADGTTRDLPDPFVVVATQNPTGEPGTHPLGQAQLDRFAVMLRLGLPGRGAEEAILRGWAGAVNLDDLAVVTDADRFRTLRAAAAEVPVHDAILRYVLDIVTAVRASDSTVWLSVRVPQTLLAVARSLALVAGRSYVAPEDVQRAVVPVFSHRLPRTISPELCLDIMATVPVPVEAS